MHLTDGTIFLTRGVAALSSEYEAAMVKRVLAFDDCPMQKDPYTVHDFSAFDHQGHRILCKMALYDEPGVKGWDGRYRCRYIVQGTRFWSAVEPFCLKAAGNSLARV